MSSRHRPIQTFNPVFMGTFFIFNLNLDPMMMMMARWWHLAPPKWHDEELVNEMGWWISNLVCVYFVSPWIQYTWCLFKAPSHGGIQIRSLSDEIWTSCPACAFCMCHGTVLTSIEMASLIQKSIADCKFRDIVYALAVWFVFQSVASFFPSLFVHFVVEDDERRDSGAYSHFVLFRKTSFLSFPSAAAMNDSPLFARFHWNQLNIENISTILHW